jgi:hypothetical protein
LVISHFMFHIVGPAKSADAVLAEEFG